LRTNSFLASRRSRIFIECRVERRARPGTRPTRRSSLLPQSPSQRPHVENALPQPPARGDRLSGTGHACGCRCAAPWVRPILVRYHASGSAVFRSRRATCMASAVHPSRPSAARARRQKAAARRARLRAREAKPAGSPGPKTQRGLASSRKRPNASISGLGRTYRQIECATCRPSSHRWRRNPLGGHARGSGIRRVMVLPHRKPC
jgi:hypothetical protein